jgi:hypothetical protein
MDFHEYFSIPEDASMRDLKRAYAKKLKMTSPEVDPDGFQYLRSIYEYAQQSLRSSELEQRPGSEVLTEENKEKEEISSDEKITLNNDLEKMSLHASFTSSGVDEIIRSLRNGLEHQALAYLDLMRENGDILSLEISSELEQKGINFLLQLKETDTWPTEFVNDYVRTLNLSEQAKSNAQLDDVLDTLYKRSTMAMNGWDSDQYEHDRWAIDAVHKAMVEIRQCLFEKGQDASIGILEEYNNDGFFKDQAVCYYFVKRYLADIDDYYPGVFPYYLAIKIEDILKFSVNFNNYTDETKKAYYHYLERRKASEVRNEKWQYFSNHSDDVKGLAIGLLFNFIDTDRVRENAISIANELEILCSALEKDDVYYFEIGGDSNIDNLNQWMKKAKARKLSAFKSSFSLKDKRLNPFAFIKDYRNITSYSGFMTFLSLFTACYGITAFNVFSKKQDYVGLINVTLIFLCVLIMPLLIYYLRCLYYSRWDSYIYREISSFRYDWTYKIMWYSVAVGLLLNIVFSSNKWFVFISTVLLLWFSKVIFRSHQLTTILLVSAVPCGLLISVFVKNELENPFLLGIVSAWYLFLLMSAGFDKAKEIGLWKTLSTFLNALFYIMIAMFSVIAAGAFVLGALK